MTLVDWDDTYSVGSEEIDNDHKKIIALLNELYEGYELGLSNPVLMNLFEQVEMVTTQHFKHEEGLLENKGYPLVDAQRAEHRLLRGSLAQLRCRFDSELPTERVSSEIREFLLTWFMGHILEEDMQFKEFLSA